MPEQRPNYNGKRGKVVYRTQDPLYIDERLHNIEGGVKAYIERIHESGDYHMPLRHCAFILYNMALEGVRDRKIYQRFEMQYPYIKADSMYPREAFGGLYGSYKQNLASKEGIMFWKNKLDELKWELHARDCASIIEAFTENTSLEKSHMQEIMKKFLCNRLLEVYPAQIKFNQYMYWRLFKVLPKIEFYDEKLYKTLIDGYFCFAKVHNLVIFNDIHNAIIDINSNPK